MNFLQQALSENNQGSSKRLISFEFSVTICLSVLITLIWLLVKSQFTIVENLVKFESGLLGAYILMILGITNMPQIIAAFKAFRGVPETPPTKDKAE